MAITQLRERSTWHRWTVPVALGTLLLVLLTLLSACSGSDEGAVGGDAASAPEAAPDRGAPGDAGAGAEGGTGGQDSSARDGGTAAGVPGAPSASDVDEAAGPRKIRRGAVTIEVKDLTRTAALVRDRAAALKGYVSDESIGLVAMTDPVEDPSYRYDTGVPEDSSTGALQPYYGPGEGRLVVRVPSTSMREAMDAFAELGKEFNRWSTETEVETALVDLESRVKTQTASVQRVRELLDRATSLSDIVTLENELAKREADLESLQAQLESLSGRAAMATVTVVMRTPDRAAEVQSSTGFVGGLTAGWEALVASTGVLLTVVGALLPFAIVLAALGVPLLVWRRRVRRDRREQAAPTA